MRIGNSHKKAQKFPYLLCLFVAFSLLRVGTIAVRAQIKYARGQNVAPAFEGWEQNPDGSYNFVFGYLNRNYEEEVDIPIGPITISSRVETEANPHIFIPGGSDSCSE